MKLTLISRSALGNENPRSITPLTTLNIVVTPQMPSASTMIGQRAERLLLDEHAEPDADVLDG